MKTFLLFGKSSPEELNEISSKYRAEIVRLVNNLGGEVKAMYILLKEKYLFFILTFLETKRIWKASVALSKLTGISFKVLPALPVKILKDILEPLIDGEKVRLKDGVLPPVKIREWKFHGVEKGIFLLTHDKGHKIEVKAEDIDWEEYRMSKESKSQSFNHLGVLTYDLHD